MTRKIIEKKAPRELAHDHFGSFIKSLWWWFIKIIFPHRKKLLFTGMIWKISHNRFWREWSRRCRHHLLALAKICIQIDADFSKPLFWSLFFFMISPINFYDTIFELHLRQFSVNARIKLFIYVAIFFIALFSDFLSIKSYYLRGSEINVIKIY